MNKNYQMVSVYQYLELVEKNSAKNEKKLKDSVNQFLLDTNRAYRDAILLEKMLG